MTLVEIKYCNALIDNKSFSGRPTKTNKKRIKNLSKYQETMITKQETYQIICTIKNTINLFVQIYQDKEVQFSLQLNSTEKLEEDNGVKNFFHC